MKGWFYTAFGRKGREMVSCSVPARPQNEPFEDVLAAMQTDKYWINFFVRPCCPPPASDQAEKMLEKRREEIRQRADYTDDQKSELLTIVDAREKWYKASPFCKG